MRKTHSPSEGTAGATMCSDWAVCTLDTGRTKGRLKTYFLNVKQHGLGHRGGIERMGPQMEKEYLEEMLKDG